MTRNNNNYSSLLFAPVSQKLSTHINKEILQLKVKRFKTIPQIFFFTLVRVTLNGTLSNTVSQYLALLTAQVSRFVSLELKFHYLSFDSKTFQNKPPI